MKNQLIEHKLTEKKILAHLTNITEKENIKLWEEFIKLHPADINQILEETDKINLQKIFKHFDLELKNKIFQEFTDANKKYILNFLDEKIKIYLLKNSQIDDLTNLFDDFSDKELKEYLGILDYQDRKKILSLLEFPADSAGGIMSIDAITLFENLTIEESIKLLQRLKPRKELQQQIYIINQKNSLKGFINIEDLVLNNPKTKLTNIIKAVPFVAQTNQDQEEIAKKMIHYHMMSVPVTNSENILLGVIQEDTLVKILQEEATEDVQRISAMPVTESYFNTTIWKLIYKRVTILSVLLIIESLTSFIISKYEESLTVFLISFFAMLVSTGGNTSSQTSSITIQGMSSGDINDSNIYKFLKREFIIGLVMALILASISFTRIYLLHHNLKETCIISFSLSLVVFLSVILGSSFPIILNKLGYDPAFSSGPFLATLMDILGIFIYCNVAYLFISKFYV